MSYIHMEHAMASPQATYGPQDWRSMPGREGPAWSGEPPWRLPSGGKPLWIAGTVLAFIVWWPIGLAALFYLIGSGRMGCGSYRRRYGAQRDDGTDSAAGRSGPWAGWRSRCGDGRATPSSGNRAFDEYRSDTLRRLEEEQREFKAFLDRLRFAKDKAEFDAFMAERRQPPASPPEPTPE
jgi:hypothetical protein